MFSELFVFPTGSKYLFIVIFEGWKYSFLAIYLELFFVLFYTCAAWNRRMRSVVMDLGSSLTSLPKPSHQSRLHSAEYCNGLYLSFTTQNHHDVTHAAYRKHNQANILTVISMVRHFHTFLPLYAISITNKQIVSCFYKPSTGSTSTCVCLWVTRRTQKKTGFLNLVPHLNQKHKTVRSALRHCQNLKHFKIFFSLLNSAKVCSLYSWVSFSVKCLQPFSVVRREAFCEHVRHSSLLLHVFKIYFPLFPTAQHSYSTAKQHAQYVRLFATYPAENKDDFEMVSLTLSMVKDETTRTAEDHITTFSHVLSNFNKWFKNFMALIGDNCSINQSKVTEWRQTLTDRFSHFFQLSLQEVIYEAEDAVK